MPLYWQTRNDTGSSLNEYKDKDKAYLFFDKILHLNLLKKPKQPCDKKGSLHIRKGQDRIELLICKSKKLPEERSSMIEAYGIKGSVKRINKE